MTVAMLIAELLRRDPTHLVYVRRFDGLNLTLPEWVLVEGVGTVINPVRREPGATFIGLSGVALIGNGDDHPAECGR